MDFITKTNINTLNDLVHSDNRGAYFCKVNLDINNLKKRTVNSIITLIYTGL